MYAIVRCGGRQHKVAVGDEVRVNRLDGEVGATVELSPVLVVDDGTVTADPDKLARCKVTAEVVGDAKGPKISIMTYKSKSGIRRRAGHRQAYTRLKVTDIQTGGGRAAAKAAGTTRNAKNSSARTSAARDTSKGTAKDTGKDAGKGRSAGTEAE